MKRLLLVIFALVLVFPLASAALLSGGESKAGNWDSTNLSDSYDEFVRAISNTTAFNTTSIISGNKLWVPWFAQDNVCGPTNLQNGSNCNVGATNMTVNCMVSDEFSEVCEVYSMGKNQTLFDYCYNTLLVINSSSGQLPSWKIFRNGTTIDACDSRTNSNCDTASDASARFINALYTAANNSAFTTQASKTAYWRLATNLTSDMLRYEIDTTSRRSLYGGNITYWLKAGTQASLGGTDGSYTAYQSDAVIAFLQACKQTGNLTYCDVARNVTLNHLQAANFNNVTFTVPPGRSYKWENLTGTPFANCTNTCSPDQWDSADAPRAYRMGVLPYYANISNITLPTQLTTYMGLWKIANMTNNNSVVLQFYSNGTPSASGQSGYLAQGLEAFGVSGLGLNSAGNLSFFNQTLRNALGHYQSSSRTMDGAACLGIYGQANSIRMLGIAIGRSDSSFGFGAAQGDAAPVVTLLAPTNGSTSQIATISFNASFTDNLGLVNATLYVWNSTGSLINTTVRAISGTSTTVNTTLVLPYYGRFTWNYQALDSVGNTAFNGTNFTVTYNDTVAPLVTILSPTNTTYTTDSVTFHVSLNENASQVRFTINNGATNFTMSTTNNLNFTYAYSGLSNGTSYTFRVFANDTNGNRNDTMTVTFFVSLPATNICDTFTTTGFRLIMLFAALAIVVFIIAYMRLNGLKGITLGGVIIVFVGVIVGLVLWQAAGQNLGAYCPVS